MNCMTPNVASSDISRSVAYTAALMAWLNTARPKDRIVYHIGHLARDRALIAASRELDRVASLVSALASEGRVIAVQQRRADGQMTYLAVKAIGRHVHGRAQ